MHAYALSHVADETLLADLGALVATDRQTTAALLAHLAEVEVRGLYLPAACSSMHAYCTRILHFSEDASYKRIRAARVARRCPQIFGAVADGRVNLTAIVLLAPHFTDGNVDELLAAATHRSKAEIELLVARLAPRPDVPTAITPVTPATGPMPLPQLVPEPVVPPAPEPPPRVKPLSPERFGLQVTISQATRDKLERATALLRHRHPSGGVAEVLDRALDALLVTLEKEKFGATARPRAKKARSEDADPRYVPNDVRRTVHARDGEQCSFVSDTGERCTERGFLELDHETPVCLGGKPTADGVRVLCRAHNQYEAERKLGADFMREKRKRAANAPTSKQSPSRSPASEPPPSGSTPFDSDVGLALRTMGFTATETSRAMNNTAALPASTFEQRIRTALAELTRLRGSRCSEAGCDMARWRSDAGFDKAGWRTESWISCG